MSTVLRKPYVRVNYPEQEGKKEFTTYGGNQKLHPEEGIRTDGCGALAASDLLSYLCDDTVYDEETYQKRLQDMSRQLFPYQIGKGTSGFVVEKGLNQYFREHQLPYKVKWGVPRRKLYVCIQRMLDQDLPVILTVGPNLPWIQKKDRLSLYQRMGQGNYQKTNSTSGHYMVITGMNEKYLRVSSWGEVYYIDREEYLTYARRHSFYYFTNVFQITVSR